MPAETRSFVFSGPPVRLDRYLSRELAPLSRTRIQKLIEEGHIHVNTGQEAPRFLLSPGDRVTVELPAFSTLPDSASDSVPVIHEDADIIVVNKPSDLVVHPAGPHQTDTLIQRLWPKLAPKWSATVAKRDSILAVRPGVVHRLDRGTSGVMVIAKSPAAAVHLSRQFAARTAKKIYWALVHGVPSTQTGHIRSVVGRDRREPHRMSVTDQGRLSETDFKVLAQFADFGAKGASLVEISPLTGRTHQIRVQFAALGHPLVGDRVYGEDEGSRPLLHALKLSVEHPRTGRRVEWTAPLADDFASILKKLGWKGKKKD